MAHRGEVTVTCANSPTDCNASLRHILGSYFQWGRNKDITNASTIAWPLASDTTNNFITTSSAPSDWLSPQDPNLWGGSGTTATGGTFITQWSPAAMQGPCAIGYHVPTAYEWWMAISSINPDLTNTPSIWQNDSSLASLLQLPCTGTRRPLEGNYTNQWNGSYVTSTPFDTVGSSVPVRSTQSMAPSGASRAIGLAVRCLKN